MENQPCEHEYTLNESGTVEWCQKCDSIRLTEAAVAAGSRLYLMSGNEDWLREQPGR